MSKEQEPGKEQKRKSGSMDPPDNDEAFPPDNSSSPVRDDPSPPRDDPGLVRYIFGPVHGVLRGLNAFAATHGLAQARWIYNEDGSVRPPFHIPPQSEPHSPTDSNHTEVTSERATLHRERGSTGSHIAPDGDIDVSQGPELQSPKCRDTPASPTSLGSTSTAAFSLRAKSSPAALAGYDNDTASPMAGYSYRLADDGSRVYLLPGTLLSTTPDDSHPPAPDTDLDFLALQDDALPTTPDLDSVDATHLLSRLSVSLTTSTGPPAETTPSLAQEIDDDEPDALSSSYRAQQPSKGRKRAHADENANEPSQTKHSHNLRSAKKLKLYRRDSDEKVREEGEGEERGSSPCPLPGSRGMVSEVNSEEENTPVSLPERRGRGERSRRGRGRGKGRRK